MDVVCRGGRKKDFWDLHYLHDFYEIPKMLKLHQQMYEWTHDDSEAIRAFINFKSADEDPNPRCLLSKEWDFVKLDFIEWIKEYLNHKS